MSVDIQYFKSFHLVLKDTLLFHSCKTHNNHPAEALITFYNTHRYKNIDKPQRAFLPLSYAHIPDR
jgi:hypothetical protein